MKELIDALLKTTEPKEEFPPPGDYHSANTVAFFGLEKCKAVYKESKKKFKEAFRGVGKVAGLALVYGSSWKAFLDWVPGTTEQGAKALYNGFFNSLPVLKRYNEKVLKQAKKDGFIRTFLNRRIYIDGFTHENFGVQMKAEREVKNYPIQGAGSEIIKYMILKIFNFTKEHKSTRWVGTYYQSKYYTRVLSIDTNQVTPELESTLEAQPTGNCKVIVLNAAGMVESEFDRNVQMTQEIVDEFGMEIIL